MIDECRRLTGDDMKTWREGKGLTRCELWMALGGRESGISEKTIPQWEQRGANQLPRGAIRLLCSGKVTTSPLVSVCGDLHRVAS